MKTALHGLYLLADESIRPFRDWAELIPPILEAGVVLVQYRAKQQASAQQREHAGQLLHWCRAAGCRLLVNDSVPLALAIGADGVHLGRDDGALRAARQTLPPGSLLGASCYNEIERARAALNAGADYVSFGRLFASQTKPQARPASLDLLRQASRQLDAPICAIGGITDTNAERVSAAGAQLLCVGGGILRAQDPVAATRKLATICGHLKTPYS